MRELTVQAGNWNTDGTGASGAGGSRLDLTNPEAAAARRG